MRAKFKKGQKIWFWNDKRCPSCGYMLEEETVLQRAQIYSVDREDGLPYYHVQYGEYFAELEEEEIFSSKKAALGSKRRDYDVVHGT